MIKNAIRKIKCILKGKEGWKSMVLLYLLRYASYFVIAVLLLLFIGYLFPDQKSLGVWEYSWKQAVLICSTTFLFQTFDDFFDVFLSSVRKPISLVKNPYFLATLFIQFMIAMPLIFICPSLKAFGTVLLIVAGLALFFNIIKMIYTFFHR